MARYEFRTVRARDLVIDPRYQRAISPRAVNRMASGWNDALVGVIEISERKDGKLVVFDGQHRVAAAEQRGEPRELDAKVHVGLTPQQEAHLWAELNRERRPAKPLEVFIAQVFAGEGEAVRMADVVKRAGYEIGFHAGNDSRSNRLQAIQTLRSIVRAGGEALLERTLTFMAELWYGDPGQGRGEFIKGLALFLQEKPNPTDAEKDRLRNYSPQVIYRRAVADRGGYAGGGGVAHPVKRELVAIARGRRGE